jgi:iron complex transport system substrate-binding protein
MWLGNLLYPDLNDLDVIEETQRFYSLFWHYELSTAEARELMANSTFLEQR